MTMTVTDISVAGRREAEHRVIEPRSDARQGSFAGPAAVGLPGFGFLALAYWQATHLSLLALPLALLAMACWIRAAVLLSRNG